LLRGSNAGEQAHGLIRLLGGEQRRERHVREPGGICHQLAGRRRDFGRVIDDGIGGTLTIVKIPRFEAASNGIEELGDSGLESSIGF
jgi:hypothetical protein